MNLDKNRFKLTGKGILISNPREWLDDNLRVNIQKGELHEVIEEHEENQAVSVGWITLGDLEITSDFTLHTKKGMKGKSFADNLKQTLILDEYSRLGEFTTGELVDVDTSQSQPLLEKFLGSNFHLGKHYKARRDENEPGVIFVSRETERVIIQTTETSVRIGGQGVFVLDRKKESLILISDKNGITIIDNGRSMVEINDKHSITIDGKEFNPASIVNHITHSISDAFSKLRYDFDFDF
ncbi:MAG: hypothetical protein ACXAC2_03645 [Candidatus Kariarchaeaceae archaeon]